MKKLHFCDKELWRVLSNNNLEKIQKEFLVQIEVKRGAREADLIIKGKNAMQEYIIESILEALSSGFDFDTAILLKDESYIFKQIHLKNYASGSRLGVVKSRIIGTQGKAKKTIERLSDCYIILSENDVAIIGKAEHVEYASKAIESIIKGTKHANVFQFLEKSREHLKELDEEDIQESFKS